MIKISNRLKSLTKYIYKDDAIIDVGCDHALLDIYLVLEGVVDKIYVCDVNENALDNGKRNIEKYDLTNKVIPILSYGIEATYELNVDTLVISGMGSKNIIDILKSPYLNKFYKLILQANNNHAELRAFIINRGYEIVDEEIVVDGGITYINIVCIKTNKEIRLKNEEIEFGPILIKDKSNLDYFINMKNTYSDIYDKSRNDGIKIKMDMLDEIIASLVNE